MNIIFHPGLRAPIARACVCAHVLVLHVNHTLWTYSVMQYKQHSCRNNSWQYATLNLTPSAHLGRTCPTLGAPTQCSLVHETSKKQCGRLHGLAATLHLAYCALQHPQQPYYHYQHTT